MNKLRKSLGIMFPAMRISFALAMLTSCILLSAEMLGFTPDEDRIQLNARKQISESMAIQFSLMDPRQDIKKLEGLVRIVARRNLDILSTDIRHRPGNLISGFTFCAARCTEDLTETRFSIVEWS
ncbi:MAG: hypothetical protein GY896_25290 [Gammaproteobacteria bacterium]|nr:hypothetical protein [Gammaproteobacteria bacterium]